MERRCSKTRELEQYGLVTYFRNIKNHHQLSRNENTFSSLNYSLQNTSFISINVVNLQDLCDGRDEGDRSL